MKTMAPSRPLTVLQHLPLRIQRNDLYTGKPKIIIAPINFHTGITAFALFPLVEDKRTSFNSISFFASE